MNLEHEYWILHIILHPYLKYKWSDDWWLEVHVSQQVTHKILINFYVLQQNLVKSNIDKVSDNYEYYCSKSILSYRNRN